MTSRNRIECQPAYLLHTRPYRNTSLIIEIFSQDFGRIGLVARGVRSSRSRLAAQLLPFQRLLLSWQGRGELKTLVDIEVDGRPCWLRGNALISGLYSNELIFKLLQRDDPHPDLLQYYETFLQALGQLQPGETAVAVQMEIILRQFEKNLLQELGYGLSFEWDARSGQSIEAECRYHYYFDEGPVLCSEPSSRLSTVSGATLLALANDEALDESSRREAKQLMRNALARHLDGRPLNSRRLFLSSRRTAK